MEITENKKQNILKCLSESTYTFRFGWRDPLCLFLKNFSQENKGLGRTCGVSLRVSLSLFRMKAEKILAIELQENLRRYEAGFSSRLQETR